MDKLAQGTLDEETALQEAKANGCTLGPWEDAQGTPGHRAVLRNNKPTSVYYKEGPTRNFWQVWHQSVGEFRNCDNLQEALRSAAEMDARGQKAA